jgi:hypothetical protein
METLEISPLEYSLMVGQLDDLQQDDAAALRSLLAEKYYAYLDRLMQLKMAVKAYDQVATRAVQALNLTKPSPNAPAGDQ